MRAKGFALAIAALLATSAAHASSWIGGGGVVPSSTCGDSSHALAWNGTAFTCQAITGSAAAGGSDTQLQRNNGGALGGISGATTDGTVVTFANSDIKLGGSSSGVTTFTSDNAGASNFTMHVPAANDTLATLAGTQTLTNKSIAGSEINSSLVGATYGGTGVNNGSSTITIAASVTTTGTGAPTLAFPSSSFTYTFQGSSDTIVGRATTDTLTNKTYDTAGTGNTFKINGTTITAISGNTATVGTKSGTWTSGNCLKSDASGNIVDAGACGGGLTVGTSTIASGTSGGILYDSGPGTLQEDSGFTHAGTGQIALALGSISSNAKGINLTATFNSSGTTFDAPFFENVTNTASHSGSLIADWQVGGASKIGFDTNGDIWLGTATGTSGQAIYSTNWLTLGGTNNKDVAALRQGNVNLAINDPICWSTSNDNPTANTSGGCLGGASNGVPSFTLGSHSFGTGVTVATLPSTPIAGTMSYVTDANAACSAGTTAVGGGSTKCLEMYNGSAWKEFGI